MNAPLRGVRTQDGRTVIQEVENPMARRKTASYVYDTALLISIQVPKSLPLGEGKMQL